MLSHSVSLALRGTVHVVPQGLTDTTRYSSCCPTGYHWHYEVQITLSHRVSLTLRGTVHVVPPSLTGTMRYRSRCPTGSHWHYEVQFTLSHRVSLALRDPVHAGPGSSRVRQVGKTGGDAGPVDQRASRAALLPSRPQHTRVLHPPANTGHRGTEGWFCSVIDGLTD